MQDRYAGDIGDFAKYSLLRAVSNGRRLGVAWYRFPDEGHNSDGKHIAYLDQADRWRRKDPDVFDKLQSVIRSGDRSLSAIEKSGVLARAHFSSEPLNFPGAASVSEKKRFRQDWFERVQSDLSSAEIVFADPDNGLIADEAFSFARVKAWKSIPKSEALALAQGRTAVIYHHNTRRKGGHDKEVADLGRWLGASFAVRARAFSPRTFFIFERDRRSTRVG